jgi:hypothetical protein
MGELLHIVSSPALARVNPADIVDREEVAKEER